MKKVKKKLKGLVIGAGSIGCRHIENLISLGIEVSAFRYRKDLKEALKSKYKIKVYDSLKKALESEHDFVVIANRTDQHIPVALSAARKGLHLYIEKPLSNSLTGVGELYKISKEKSLIIEIGCMMRFHPDLKLIKNFIQNDKIGKIYFVRSCVGQYLPDWRPNTDYRNSYSAKVKYGGGVLLDLIHELDYLYWWFGKVYEVSAFLERTFTLNIETEDIAQILLRFESGIVGQVEMDYLSPFYRRTSEIVGSKGIISWDYNTGEIIINLLGQKEPIILKHNIDRNIMFINHMNYFLNRIISKNLTNPAVSLEDGIETLKIAIAARRSSIEKKVIKLCEIML